MLMMFLSKLEKHIEQLVNSNMEIVQKMNYFMGSSVEDRKALRKTQEDHREWLLKHDDALESLSDLKKKANLS